MSIQAERPKHHIISQLKAAIEKFNHTQKEVAEMLGISDSSLSRIIHGHESHANLATKLMRKIRLYISYGKVEKDEEIIPQKDIDRLGKAMEKPIYSKEALEFTKIHYIRDDNYRPIGTLVAILVPAEHNPDAPFMVSIGLAMCNTKHDTFIKKIGKELAIARAKEHWKEYEYVNHQTSYYQDVHTEVNNFIQECIHYYKGKSIILPKIVLT